MEAKKYCLMVISSLFWLSKIFFVTYGNKFINQYKLHPAAKRNEEDNLKNSRHDDCIKA